METKQYRLTLTIAGREIVGVWRNYNAKEFARDCTAMALNQVMFIAEFQ